MAADARLRDDEILQFVLAPGFSTAKSVTQISGRGVGMDVVHSAVKQLGGSITIMSIPGKGTRFTVRLPFTVSVNRALMVSIGEDQYAMPLNTIEGIVRVSGAELAKLYQPDGGGFEYAGVPYRVRYLGSFIGRDYVSLSDRGSVPVVLVRSGDRAVAVHVDGVQGSREIVVKSLGPQFAGVGGISGATILGDGSVVVILDLVALIRAQTAPTIANGHAGQRRRSPDLRDGRRRFGHGAQSDLATARTPGNGRDAREGRRRSDGDAAGASPRHHAARHRNAAYGRIRSGAADSSRRALVRICRS